MRSPHSNTVSLITLTMAALALLELFATTAAYAKGNRSKVIDFEDEVVEGMNKRPLDSVSQISERDKKKRKQHLYKKRVGFRTETAETLRNLRYR